MKEIANKQFGMNIIYGDTDSIFVSGINEEHCHEPVDSFITACRQNLEIEVDHQNTFVKCTLIDSASDIWPITHDADHLPEYALKKKIRCPVPCSR
jgi:DNA polymerase elongation subunit (family B)